MKNNLRTKFYDIMTTEGTDEATILMYGYIGEAYDWYTNESVGIEDIDFVRELEALAAKYPTIHIRINSPGGEVFHGSAMVTAIRNCKAEVHTWIDGVAASMAGVIWMAGKKRHMAKNGMLMLHSASNICWGNAKEMRELADILDKFDETLVIAAADSVGISEADFKAKFFDYKDHWLTFNDVKAEGWLTEDPDEYAAATKLPSDLGTMDYRKLVALFEDMKNPPKAEASLFSQLKNWLEDAKSVISGKQLLTSNAPYDMVIEEFKASLADGKLKLNEVRAHLDSLTPEPTPEPTPPPAEPESEALTALRNQMDAMRADFTNKLQALGAQPGAEKSTPGLPNQDLPAPGAVKTAAQLLEENEAELLAAAQKGEHVIFAPSARTK